VTKFIDRDERIFYFHTSKRVSDRSRIASLLNDYNALKQIFYGGLSRLLIMFPYEKDRRMYQECFYTFFDEDLFDDTEVREWMKEADKDIAIIPVVYKDIPIDLSFLELKRKKHTSGEISLLLRY